MQTKHLRPNLQRTTPQIHATKPLTARLEPWMRTLLDDAPRVRAIIDTYGSPTNVLHPDELVRNAAQLVDAGARCGVTTKVFFARKANKALAFVNAAHAAGHGIDVASLRELTQVLSCGVEGRKVIVSAAVKEDRLLQHAVDAEAVISCDSIAELQRISAVATRRHATAKVAPRLAPSPTLVAPTRFGERLEAWTGTQVPDNVDILGVHVHLSGYSEADRRAALSEAFPLVDHYRALGHQVEFIDLGGGVPMSYLANPEEFAAFNEAMAPLRVRKNSAKKDVAKGKAVPFTWDGDPLNNVYPFWQSPTRGEWLQQLLHGNVAGYGTAATAFAERNLRLHLEPGRSLLDGCGVILADVAFLKERSDGLPLIGLAMNRTQCRTAADDILLDPILVPCADLDASGTVPRRDMTGYLVGAYCIENEVIIRREIHAQQIAVGDVIAIPNTAGYFMHIVESASHQIPLATNVILDNTGELQIDDIDS